MSLEIIFRQACERHENLRLLESQWRFDKELISKALQNVTSIFPHFSRHDASHSRQIIINIERMLGGRINHLTATDMWLILESAYCHDIGMVVTHKQIQDMNTPEFKDFVQDISEKPNNELGVFAQSWLNGSATLPNGAAAHEFFDEYRQLIAEWFRKKHPENARKIIHNPFEEIGLDSPRNELLPKRLFSVLASICNAHGQPFDKVMELPFSEAGMGLEDCHPRYVAFLLRMADLLDIDDNRFCPVMMRMSGASLPTISHAHLEKHQGIRHFRLDSESIEIETICPSLESYEVAHDWFRWLENEYYRQSQNWTKIVPSGDLGRLPTLSPPKVSMKRPFLIINEGERPRFEINKDSILKLLRGTGLYTSKTDSVREILQNAVDSTIIAIWEKHKDEIKDLNPSSQRLIDIYNNNCISVDLSQHQEDKKIFTLVVTDVGMGISKADIEHMLEVGSSSKNSNKSKIVRQMPEWYKPSGNFGIGLQSIALLSDKFTIVTKSRSSNEAFRLTFNSGKGSSVVIESLPQDSTPYGAALSVDISIEEFPEKISIPWNEGGDSIFRELNAYDFTKPGSDLRVYEEIKILEAIRVFNNESPIKITTAHNKTPQPRGSVFFSKRFNVVLKDINFFYSDISRIDTYFRGQPFSDLNFSAGLVCGSVDFYGYQAIDFLTYNREKILYQAKRKANSDIKNSILEFIDVKFPDIPMNVAPCAAAFYAMNSDSADKVDKYESYLMQFDICKNDFSKVQLGAVLDGIKSGAIKTIRVCEPTYMGKGDSFESGFESSCLLIKGGASRLGFDLIKYFGTKKGLFWQEKKVDKFHSYIVWHDEDVQPFDDELVNDIVFGQNGNFEIGSRRIFPAWGKYRKLSIIEKPPYARMYSHLSFDNDFMVLPYKFGHDGVGQRDINKDLVDWVFEHKKHKNVTKDEIVKLYEALIEHIESITSNSSVEKNPS